MIDSVGKRIEQIVGAWADVSVTPHRFGGVEFRVGRRELGHLHGSRLADLPFPIKVRDRLVAEGKAEPHHVLPRTGWVSRWISGADDIDDVVALFRLNYERPWSTREKRTEVGSAPGPASISRSRR